MSSPTTYTWPLVVPALPAPGSTPSTSSLAPGAGISSPNPSFLSEADILSVLDRILPDWYLESLKDPGPGYEIFQAWAAAFERVSLAIGRAETAMMIVYSHGGALATADVQFYRQNTGSGAFTVKAGTVCRTGATSRSFVLLGDVAFASGDLVASGKVRAVAPGAEYNVTGPRSAADGTVLPGEIDTIPIPLLDPVFSEPGIQVRQLQDATGGQAAVLDQLGLDRRLPRTAGESDEVYKGRVRQLPDTVSPDALRRQLDSVFLPLGLSYTLTETWQNEYQTCYDAPNVTVVHPILGVIDPDCFVLDAPSNAVFRGRLLDERDHIGGLVIVVPEIGAWSERSFAFDDTTTSLDSGTLGPSSTFAQRATTSLVAWSDATTPEQVTTGTSTWQATLQARRPGDSQNGHIHLGTPNTVDVGVVVVLSFETGADLVEVRDGQRYDTGTLSWVVAPGAVGVRARASAGLSVQLIEAAINATSAVVQVIPDANGASKVVDQAIFTALSMFAAPLRGGIASNETDRGWRARSVLDAPDIDGDPSLGQFIRVPFLDGYDLLHQEFYKNLSALVTAVKGGGTSAVIELEGQ